MNRRILGRVTWRAFLTALALLLGLTLIWHQAPRLSYDGRSLFASPWARAWLVIALFAGWGLFFVARWLVRASRGVRIVWTPSQAEQDDVTQNAQRTMEVNANDVDRRERAALAHGFKTALGLIRGRGWFGRWSRRVRVLPWYLVLGAPSTGKSGLLQASGLGFSHEKALAAITSTAQPHRWWLADEAVLVEASVSGDGRREPWCDFLRRLRRARGRTIQGTVVVVDVGLLNDANAAARATYAATIRERLDALHEVFGVRVPVYVAITCCDRLPGFERFFEGCDEHAKAQVWGMTFPVDARSPDGTMASFPTEFDALCARVQARVVEHMPTFEDAARSAAICRFPIEFAAVGDPLQAFLKAAFGASPYLPDTFVRGVYFTAATPAGPDNVPSPRGPARGYFIARLLREVIFKESALAGTRFASPRRRALTRRIAWGAIVLVTMAAAACLIISYQNNLASIAAVRHTSSQLDQLARAGVQPAEPVSMLAVLDAARDVPHGYAQRGMGTPLLSRFGLSQGGRLGAAARAQYQLLLRRTIEPFIVARAAKEIAEHGANAAARYALLRVYLMLTDHSHFDSATVLDWVTRDAQTLSLTAAQRADWLSHADAWLNGATLDENKPDLEPDAALIDRARATIAATPRAERIFESIEPALASACPQPLSVAGMAGDDAALVLLRKSGKPLTDGVPSSYTLSGYRHYLALRDAALRPLNDERWVMNVSAHPDSPAERSALAADVDRYYFDHYIAAWNALLDDVTLRPLPKTADGAAIVKLLARPDSPMRMFLLAAAKQTTLAGAAVTPPPAHAAPTWFGAFLARVRGGGGNASSQPAPATSSATTPVDRRFEALHRFVEPEGEGKPTSLDQVQQTLSAAGSFLDAVNTAHANGLPAPAGDALTQLKQAALGQPEPVAGMLRGLSASGMAATLSGEHQRLNALWRADVASFFHSATSGRYPFVKTSNEDVTLDDFARLFAPNGLFDQFFKQNLQQYVDTSTTPWQWRPDAAGLGMSKATLKMFRQAAAIRDAYFESDSSGASSKPSVHFTLTPESMDPKLTRFVLTRGDKTLEYAHDPRRTVTFDWPGNPSDELARIDYAPAGADGRSALQARGPWRIFRLLGQGRLTPDSSTSFQLTFELGGRAMTLKLDAASVVNPFALDALAHFRCVQTL